MGIELGDLVKDRITGYQGVAVSLHIFMTGCNRWGVKSRTAINKDGVPADSQAYDENQLEIVEKHAVVIDIPANAKAAVLAATSVPTPPGGPNDIDSGGRGIDNGR